MAPAGPWGSFALPPPHCWPTQSDGAVCHRGRGQQSQQEVALTESCQFWFEAAIIPEVF